MTDDVLVIGGGIAGLGLARALTQRGVPYTVIERLPGPAEAGLGLNLPGNAIRALAALGVAEEVVSAGVQVRRREYRTQSGRLLFEVDEEAFWGDVGVSVCVRRAALVEIFQAAVPPSSIRWGCTVEHAQPADHFVQVRLGSGAVEDHAYVVGADGVSSRVRPVIAGENGIRPSAMTTSSWRFVVPNPGVDCWTVWSGRSGTVLLIPVNEHHVYGYASNTRGAGAGEDLDWLASTFTAFPPPVRDAIGAALDDRRQLHFSPVMEVHVDRWSQPRMTLIGDAAHAIGPVWAQGAALALEDALVLTELLSEYSDWAGGRCGVRAAQAPARRARASRHRPDVAARRSAGLVA